MNTEIWEVQDDWDNLISKANADSPGSPDSWNRSILFDQINGDDPKASINDCMTAHSYHSKITDAQDEWLPINTGFALDGAFSNGININSSD